MDKFRFFAYLSPPPAKVGNGEFAENENMINEENYRNMLDCGFDSAIGLFEKEKEHYLSGMKCADKVGIDYYVRDQQESGSIEQVIWDGEKSSSANEQLKRYNGDIVDRFDSYCMHQSFKGILATDEPSATKFSAIKKAQDYFKKLYPDKDYIVNLLPTYGNNEQLYGDMDFNGDYQKDYVEKFIKEVKPQVLCYDHYPLCFDKNDKPFMLENYLRNLEVFAECSKKYFLDFYVFLQTMGCLNLRLMRTYNDIAWQVYSAMAYGAKGAMTFTYWTLLSNGKEEKIISALTDRFGNKTDAWYAMQKTIKEVKFFEKEYLKYKYYGTMVVNGKKEQEPNFKHLQNVVKSYKKIDNIEADNNFICGIFEKEDKVALMVMNFSDPILLEQSSITISCKNNAVIYQNCQKRINDDSNKIRLNLQSGEGAFIIL